MKLILDPEFWKSRLTIRTPVGAFALEAMDKMDRNQVTIFQIKPNQYLSFSNTPTCKDQA